METLDYGGIVEKWKVDLVVNRARRMGFKDDEIFDVQQELVIDLLNFRYDGHKSNGATETTALIVLIDNWLKKFVRSRARYRFHVKRFKKKTGQYYESSTGVQLAIDVRGVVSSLPAREREVCSLLGRGYSLNEVAGLLGCGWHTVKRIVRRIERQFKKRGLDEWMRH